MATLLGIGVIVQQTTRLKLHAFAALTFGCVVLSVVVGAPCDESTSSFASAFGATVTSVGLLIGLGAMLGKLPANGAQVIADTVLARSPGHRQPRAENHDKPPALQKTSSRPDRRNPTPEVRVPRFVGRDAELQRVTNALKRPPALVLVEGEAGIGKSRLILEALALVGADTARALVATCPPFRESMTLGPMVDAARQAVPSTAQLAKLRLSPLAGTLRALFPEWAIALPCAPEPLTDAGASRHRLIRAFAELLDRLGMDILVVEDVHWADETTLELLLFLASQHPLPFSLVLTYRPEEVSADSMLLRLSSRIPPRTATSHARISLDGLALSETAHLVSSMLDDEPVSASLAAFLHSRTEGAPLALEECVRLLLDRSSLVQRGGAWTRRTLDEIAVPPTIRDAVTERVARLGTDTQQVLLAAAVLGDPADGRALAVVSGLAEGQRDPCAGSDGEPGPSAGAGSTPALNPSVESAVDHAVRSGLLAEERPSHFAFRHALAARAVYSRASVLERRTTHRRAAALLETVRPLPVDRIAYHLREGGDTGRWYEYAERASDVALATGDHLTAVNILQDLLNEPHLPAAAVVRLVGKMPFYAFTCYTRRKDVLAMLRGILDSDRLSVRERAEVRGQLAQVLTHQGEYAAAATELQRVIPDLRDTTYADAWAMTALGNPMFVQTWSTSIHLRWLERAQRFDAHSAPSRHERLALQVNRTTALLELGEQSGWTLAGELVDDESTPQIALQRARADLNIGNAAMRWGHYAQARRRLTRAVDMARRHGYQRVHDLALVTLLHLDYLTGAWQGLAEQAEQWSNMDDEPMCRLKALLVAACLKQAKASDIAEVEDVLQMVRQEAERRGAIGLWLESAAYHARLCLASGDHERVRGLTQGPMRLITHKNLWIWASDVMPVRTAALSATGRLAEVEILVRAFDDWLRDRQVPAAQAALEECRAVLLEGREDFHAAVQAWNAAARAWARLPRPQETARARAGADRCARVTRDVWRGGRRGYGDELSPREREVVRLVLCGLTNRQIAEQLSRSPNTVAAQLKSAMRKRGVTSRTALAVRVSQDEIAEGHGVL
jgi:DNA-binding CsgD family transcriptional regulator